MSQCSSCGESLNANFNLRRCQHIICTKCMVTYLKALNSPKIKCPIKECTRNIPDSIIRECLSNNQLTVYDKLCQPRNSFKCLIKKCPFVLSFESKQNQFECSICHQPNCLICNTMHYPNERCFQTDQTKYEKAASNYIKSIERAQIELYDETHQLVPNPEGFDCPICGILILPRKGIILRNCLHSYCKDCLQNTFVGHRYINQMTCSVCSTPFKEKEIKALIGNDKLLNISINALKTKFFNCKEPDCNAFWDIGDYKGKYRCPKCKKENCIACEFVHEGLTCRQFKESNNYKTIKGFQNKLKNDGNVTCIKCSRKLIKMKGCGALRCDKCNINICAFTGKLVGKGGCNCTTQKPCHKDCKFGCIPD